MHKLPSMNDGELHWWQIVSCSHSLKIIRLTNISVAKIRIIFFTSKSFGNKFKISHRETPLPRLISSDARITKEPSRCCIHSQIHNSHFIFQGVGCGWIIIPSHFEAAGQSLVSTTHGTYPHGFTSPQLLRSYCQLSRWLLSQIARWWGLWLHRSGWWLSRLQCHWCYRR